MINRGNIDRHLYHMIAVVNRVDIPEELIGIKVGKFNNVKDIPVENFIPNKGDEESLKSEVMILVSRDLVKYFEEVKWMEKYVVKHIKHQYSEVATHKSTVVS